MAASALGSLLVILLVLGAAALLLRRWRGPNPMRRGGGQAELRLAATLPLGGANLLAIAEADGARFLIAITRGGVSPIGRLDARE